MSETCVCTGRMTGYTQHPEFRAQGHDCSVTPPKPFYLFEFFVCGVCLLPTAAYLAKKMESVE